MAGRKSRPSLAPRTSPRALLGRLFDWHADHRRGFAFRTSTDPFKVLVTEILLRQTQAVQVDSVWLAFFREFPNPETLAEANLDHVRAILRPLGISRRAEGVKRIAAAVVSDYDGRVPVDPGELTRLPGVGNYVSGSVRWFAYGIPEPIVDVNINRVLGRLLGIEQNSVLGRERVVDFYRTIQKDDRSTRELHFALLDLAHEVCKPHRPRCGVCPLQEMCTHTLHRRTD